MSNIEQNNSANLTKTTQQLFYLPTDQKPIKKDNPVIPSLNKQKNQRRQPTSSPQSSRSKTKNRKQQRDTKDQNYRRIKKQKRRSRSRSRQNRDHRSSKNIYKKQIASKQLTYFKTKLCPQFQSGGQCPKGSKCSYAHGQHQLKQLPNFKKTKLCIAYSQNKCPYNSWDCKYAHGQLQLKKSQNDHKRENQNIMNKYKFEHYPASNFNYPYMVPNQSNNPYLISNYPPTNTNFVSQPTHINPPVYQPRPLPTTNWSPYSIPNVNLPQTGIGMNIPPPSYEQAPYNNRNWQFGSGVNINNQYLSGNPGVGNNNPNIYPGNLYYNGPLAPQSKPSNNPY